MLQCLPQLNCKILFLQPSQHLHKIRGYRENWWVLEQQRSLTAGRQQNKILMGILALPSLGEGHLRKGHQLGSLHNGPERCTWASHSNSNSCLKPLVSLGACQAAGSYANLDIRMHKRRFKWQREVRVTDQDSFSVHIHSVNQLDWKKTQNYQEEGMDE